MYKVIKINERAATRFIELLNEKTGTRDICFDYSALVSYDNFDFMEVGQSYNCKIKLFGESSVEEKTPDSVTCEIINKEVTIGRRKLIEVLVDGDIYYILKDKVANIGNKKTIYFEYTRKDLIQVNDVIHDDLL